ncbi:deoxynucleotidyltransferase terminal-interacting protein 2 [Cololabis saira]|uniref:deoxynucleotidyltransferase terminal-interacting protein 2 n=1 Tax=Cololabis saira TaxID=129043 RepID=UPI002AD55E6D|nr:deoxynucleotidyltransferase terminal-interacting protein 2 [Cololabis saira]
MVATRRGVRVISPTRTLPEKPAEVQATPSTGRPTRRSQHRTVETCGQLDSSEGGSPVSSPTSTRKRCRASRLHSPEQPSTPQSSIPDADMSDVESCCSAVSNTEPPMTRTRARTTQLQVRNQDDQEISEAESCSSAVSAPKPVQSSRRSTRKKTLPENCETVQAKAGDVDEEPALKTESSSVVVSGSQRVTRSLRKTTLARVAECRQTEDSELSDADSCTSSISRRASRRRIRPIPMHMEELSEGSQSPARTNRRSGAAKGKAAPTSECEPISCDSDGFESGPSCSSTTWLRGRTRSTGLKATESDSDLTDVHSPAGSPMSTRSKGTPCSSRAGSRTSSRSTPASRRLTKDFTVAIEASAEPAEEALLDDSRLETTVTGSDAERTLLEETTILISEDPEQVNNADPSEEDTKKVEKEVIDVSDHNSQVAPTTPVCSVVIRKLAVIVSDQQEEPSGENTAMDTSENGMMQETTPSCLESRPSVKVTICESAAERAEGAEEARDAVNGQLSQADEAPDEDADLETRPSVEDEMEVITLETDVQQVVDDAEVHTEAVQVTVDSHVQQQTNDPVQKRKVISLLDSSDDESDEENEISEEEGSGHSEEERGETSCRPKTAAASVDGLFMIDTRPGQEADQNYYTGIGEEEEKKKRKKQAKKEEEDEEFVDEEGVDDEDEDAEVLFSSRNAHLSKMSSRIDPGIRVKELGGLYITFDGSKSKPVSSSQQKLKEKKIQDEVMKKSVIGPDFEKKDAVPPYSESKQALKLKRRAEREKSTGDGWFNMKAPEMTHDLKGDLQVLKMRGSLDPKRFYKKNDRDGFPKYFQVGTVVDSPVDFYHSRVPKSQRKRTMVEELLADANFRQQNKKRYQNIMMEKAAQRSGKSHKKKNTFKKKSK